MTPQERELIMKVAQRIQNAPQQTKDPEAERLISEQMARRPDADYLLTQAVIVQEYGLQQAQDRIQGLEQELAQARSAQPAANAGSGSFLGGLFGGSSTPAAQPTATAQTQRAAMQAGRKGPAAAQAQSGRPMTKRAGNQAGGQAGNQQQGPAGGNRGGMGDFMRNAAMMAVGVAGGQMLFSGLQGMFNDDPADGGGDTAVADMATPEDTTAAADNAEPAAEDGGGWGADEGVSEEALSGDPSMWEQPDPAADAADPWGAGAEDETLSDGGFDEGGFDDGGGDDFGGDDFGGDDDWG